MENEEFVVFPEKRVSKLRKNKEMLEQALEVKISIGPKGEVSVTGEGMECWDAKSVLEAISRGFSVKKAMLLKNEKFVRESIDVEEFAKEPEDMKRVKARVIGRQGIIKKRLQEMTSTHIMVDNKTISIIGKYDDAMDAKEAIVKIMDGGVHAAAFRMLEKKMRDKKIKRMAW